MTGDKNTREIIQGVGRTWIEDVDVHPLHPQCAHTTHTHTGRMVLVTQGLRLTRRTPHHDLRPLFKGVRDERCCEDRLNM